MIEPVNIAGPMFVNVEEPETVSEPEIRTLPLTSSLVVGFVFPIPTPTDVIASISLLDILNLVAQYESILITFNVE